MSHTIAFLLAFLVPHACEAGGAEEPTCDAHDVLSNNEKEGCLMQARLGSVVQVAEDFSGEEQLLSGEVHTLHEKGPEMHVAEDFRGTGQVLSRDQQHANGEGSKGQKSLVMITEDFSRKTQAHKGEDQALSSEAKLQENMLNTQVLGAMMFQSVLRCKSYLAHSFLLQRTTASLSKQPYASGQSGRDSCPCGYSPILDADTCEKAATFLGFTYQVSANRNIGGANSVCNYCGGCSPKTVRIDATHKAKAKWICMLSGKGGSGAVASASASADLSSKPLDKLVDDFIHKQSGSQDACHSQLMESRHQLNQLHHLVTDLAQQVNSTEHIIIILDKELQQKLREVAEIERWKAAELEKCDEKKRKDIEMFTQLAAELEEMKQIASPSVAMDINGSIVHVADDTALLELPGSFFQMEKDRLSRGPLARILRHASVQLSQTPAPNGTLPNDTQANSTQDNGTQHNSTQSNTTKPSLSTVSRLVRATKDASLEFQSCMLQSKSAVANAAKAVSALLQGKKEEAGSNAASEALAEAAEVDYYYHQPLEQDAGDEGSLELLSETQPGNKEAPFTKKYTGKWPKCKNMIKAMKGNIDEVQAQCLKMASCDGFSYNTKGQAYLKASCQDDGNWKLGYVKGKFDWWQKTSPADENTNEGANNGVNEGPGEGDEAAAAGNETGADDPEAAADDAVSERTDFKESSPQECKEQKEKLEKVYVKAYVELSRLKSEYDVLANSTDCRDKIMAEYKVRIVVEEEADRIAERIPPKQLELQKLRPQLEAAKQAETKLHDHLMTLNEQCSGLEPTISDLGKVRDMIRALSHCPGLSRAKFHLPKWTGKWATLTQDAKRQSDEQQDQAMDAACAKAAPGSRAAESGEIQEQTIEGIPQSNTAPNVLIGKCPNCEGDADEAFLSKHARVCWPKNNLLSLEDRKLDCGKGKKSVMCVIDQGDIRNIPGSQQKPKLTLNGVDAFKVLIGTGRCMSSKIVAACEKYDMTALCDQQSYSRTRKCWPAPGKYANRHFSHPAHNKLLKIDSKSLAGTCFFGLNGDWALYNDGYASMRWTSQVAANVVIKGEDKQWKASDMDTEGWFGMCVCDKPPCKNVPDEEAQLRDHKKKMDELRGSADMLLGTVPAFKTSVGTGRCTGAKIEQACKKADMMPLCDTKGYASRKKCVPLTEPKYNGHFFSVPQHNKRVGIDNDALVGMCFWANGAVHGDALFNTGTSHSWVMPHRNANPNIVIRGKDKTWKSGDQDRDGWFTLCTKQ